MYKEGDLTFYNHPIENWTARRCWDDVLKQSDYENRKLQVDEFNRSFVNSKFQLYILYTVYVY